MIDIPKLFKICSAVALFISTTGFATIPIIFDSKLSDLTTKHFKSLRVKEKIFDGRNLSVQSINEATILNNQSIILKSLGDEDSSKKALNEAKYKLEQAAYEIYSVLKNIQFEDDIVSKGKWETGPKFFDIHGELLKIDDFNTARKKLDEYLFKYWKPLMSHWQSSKKHPFFLNEMNVINDQKNKLWYAMVFMQGVGLIFGILSEIFIKKKTGTRH